MHAVGNLLQINHQFSIRVRQFLLFCSLRNYRMIFALIYFVLVLLLVEISMFVHDLLVLLHLLFVDCRALGVWFTLHNFLSFFFLRRRLHSRFTYFYCNEINTLIICLCRSGCTSARALKHSTFNKITTATIKCVQCFFLGLIFQLHRKKGADRLWMPTVRAASTARIPCNSRMITYCTSNNPLITVLRARAQISSTFAHAPIKCSLGLWSQPRVCLHSFVFYYVQMDLFLFIVSSGSRKKKQQKPPNSTTSNRNTNNDRVLALAQQTHVAGKTPNQNMRKGKENSSIK